MDGRALLNDEIQKEIEELRGLEIGTEEHKIAVDGVAKLMEKAIELDKLDSEAIDRERNRDSENNYREQQLKADKRDRLVKNILTGAGIIIPVTVTIWGTLASFKFEETGTVTTVMGRGFLNKLLPKK